MADRTESKTLIYTRQSDHFPHWYGVPVRVFLITLVGTLLSFSVTLLLAISGTVIVAAVRGLRPDMHLAYEYIALPIALIAGVIILLLASVHEIRHFQQRKTLRAIERMG